MTREEIERLRVLMIEKFRAYQKLRPPDGHYETLERRDAWWDYVATREKYLRESAEAEGRRYRKLEVIAIN